MRLVTNKLKKELSEITGVDSYVVINVSTIFKYVDGKKTDEIDGVKYTVANPETFENFAVKVNSKTALLTQKEIENSETRFWITFDNAFVIPYKIEFGKAICSIKADFAKLVNNDDVVDLI